MKLVVLTSGDERAASDALSLATKLGLQGVREVTEPEEVPEEPSVVLIGTGGTEDLIEETLERCPAVLLLHWDLYNSLAAALEVGAETVHAGDAAEAVEAFKRLVGSRILVFEGKCDWIKAEDPRDLPYLDTVGMSIDVLELVDPCDVRGILREAGVDVKELDDEFLDLAGRLESAIREEGVDHVTGDCFAMYEEFGAVPCLYFAARVGVEFTCEGDSVALVTDLLRPPEPDVRSFMGNVVDVSWPRVLLAHCACPLELGEDFKVTDHMETGGPHAVRVKVRRGRAVLARYPGTVVGCEVTGEPDDWTDRRCATQVEIVVDEDFEPEGNHHRLYYGADRELMERTFRAVHLNPEPQRR